MPTLLQSVHNAPSDIYILGTTIPTLRNPTPTPDSTMPAPSDGYILTSSNLYIPLTLRPRRTTAPAYFRSSLLSASVASTILGFINLLILAFQIIPTGLPYQISGPLFNILFSISVIAVLPLQLCLTFLTLDKLTPTRRANLLSRANLLIISLSLLLTVTTSIAYLAYFEQIITEEYSHYQPCCQQPTYYED